MHRVAIERRGLGVADLRPDPRSEGASLVRDVVGVPDVANTDLDLEVDEPARADLLVFPPDPLSVGVTSVADGQDLEVARNVLADVDPAQAAVAEVADDHVIGEGFAFLGRGVADLLDGIDERAGAAASVNPRFASRQITDKASGRHREGH